jgi:CarD family transcriptional regulator
MFIIGEKVVYPVHGAGVIEAIEQREILGEFRSYYVLRLSTGDLRVLIPVDTVEKAGMRIICDRQMLDQVEHILQGEPSPWEDNWNRRYRLNMDKIKSGDICQLAEVVRNLTVRDSARPLSAGEKKMLDNARKILLSEVVLAAGISMEAAQARLAGIFSENDK